MNKTVINSFTGSFTNVLSGKQWSWRNGNSFVPEWTTPKSNSTTCTMISMKRTTCVLNTLQLPKDLSHIWKKHINHIRTGKLRDRQKNNLIYCRASRPRLSFRELFSYRPGKELREYQTILLSYSLQKNMGIT